jgi:hypothetical protein
MYAVAIMRPPRNRPGPGTPGPGFVPASPRAMPLYDGAACGSSETRCVFFTIAQIDLGTCCCCRPRARARALALSALSAL